MEKSTGLFKLIKSLTKSEKGYFKKFVQGFGNTGDSDYLLLFNLIDKSEKPDDPAIENYFGHRKKKVNIRALRRYLHQLIIKSLRLYYEKNNYRFEATNKVNEVEVLINKGFDNEAFDLAVEGVQHCNQYELHELKLLFLGYEHLTFGDLKWEELPHRRELARTEILKTLKQLEYITEIKHLELAIIYLANSFFPTNDAGKLQELEKLANNPVLSEYNEFTALEPILGYHNICRAYETLKGNAPKAYYHSMQITGIIESRNKINKNFIGRYVRGILNAAKCSADLGKKDESWQLLEKLKATPVDNMGDAEWLELSYVSGLIYYLKAFPAPDRTELAKYAEEKIINTTLFSGAFKLICILDIAIFYFSLKNFHHSLDLLDIIINKKTEGSKVVYVHTRLLQIVIHYELGNKLLLPSLMKSTFRFMSKAEIKFDFERIVLRFFTRVLRTSNHVVLKDELAWMKNEMQKAALSEYEKTPLKVFNYIGWLSKKADAQ